jgi:hypothetical protein
MYYDILSSILSDWVDELDGDALIDFAQVCRIEMLQSNRGTAVIALAAELSYDRALIKLCEAHAIETTIVRYSHPQRERARLEAALSAIGIDLVSASRDNGD